LGGVAKKLAVIRAVARLDYPTADIDRILAEFDSGFDGFPGIARLS